MTPVRDFFVHRKWNRVTRAGLSPPWAIGPGNSCLPDSGPTPGNAGIPPQALSDIK